MKLTLGQFRLLSNPKPTTRLKAANQLAAAGFIEITRRTAIKHHKYDSQRPAVEYRVTERGRDEMELAKF